MFRNGLRTWIKSQKKFIWKQKNPATGGGPPRKLKKTTELIIDIYGNESPMFWGISGAQESRVEGVLYEVEDSSEDLSPKIATVTPDTTPETSLLSDSSTTGTLTLHHCIVK